MHNQCQNKPISIIS